MSKLNRGHAAARSKVVHTDGRVGRLLYLHNPNGSGQQARVEFNGRRHTVDVEDLTLIPTGATVLLPGEAEALARVLAAIAGHGPLHVDDLPTLDALVARATEE